MRFLRNISDLFLPTDCKLCYWGRLAAAAGFGVLLGSLTPWIAAIFFTITFVMAGLKWIVTYGSTQDK